MQFFETFKKKDSDACFERLYQILHEYEKEGKMLIAYSGGVDSALLCDIAWECAQEKMVALLLTGPFIPQYEVDEAISFARKREFPLLVCEYNMLTFSDITKNTKERCAYCKQQMAALLWEIADERGCSTVIDGVCSSDIHEYRPGIEVSTKAGIKHPFLECGITKTEIRNLAQRRGLTLWNKPSAACLASRIPYGTPLTKDLLQLAERTERYLHEHGFSPIRVRIHNDIARIEIAPEQFQKLIEMREEIVSTFREFGMVHITLDLLGYRSGSMDDSWRGEGGT